MDDPVFGALKAGAILLTASHRLARHLLAEYGAHMERAGHAVWETPAILSWSEWLARCWELSPELAAAHGRTALLLTPFQVQALWERLIEESQGDSLLQVPAAAQTAFEAWRLVQEWRLPLPRAADAPSEDVAAFAGWARAFEERCRKVHWLDGARLPEVLREAFAERRLATPPELLLAGFDEFTPRQQDLIETLKAAGCRVTVLEPADAPRLAAHTALPDRPAEILAAARWARAALESGSGRVGIVIPELAAVRHTVARIFDEILVPAALLPQSHELARPYNISLGTVLAEVPLVHTALLILEWADQPLAFPETGSLLRSPFLATAEAEMAQRALLDTELRRLGELKVPVETILRYAAAEAHVGHAPRLAERLRSWHAAVKALPRQQPPSAWSESFARLLSLLGWPGERTLTSEEFQAVEAWRKLLPVLSGLDLVRPALSYGEALRFLRRLAAETIFQPQTPEVPVQVLGLLEAAGMEFDRLWVMGLHDGAWPLSPRPNPFLPLAGQRECGLPHASAERELAFARRRTHLLSRSAREVVFSYPQNNGDEILRPSPLIMEYSPLPADSPVAALPGGGGQTYEALLQDVGALETLEDARASALPAGAMLSGGTRVFQQQAACPFRAFGEMRLGAKPLEEPQAGLDARTRGNLLHGALAALWRELETHERLCALSDPELARLIGRSVRGAVEPEARRRPQTFTARFSALEQERLRRLLHDWLALEKARAPFRVVACEHRLSVTLGGLGVEARLDRLDETADGQRVLIDYKTGPADPKSWFGERPDEPQLPIYALASPEPVAAVLFARLKPGETGFRGLAATAGIAPGAQVLGQHRLTAALGSWAGLLGQWRATLEALGAAFRAGDARVDPKTLYETCKYCALTALCRIHERAAPLVEGEDAGDE